MDEHWLKGHWRPAMGWMYMIVCIFDFIIFPGAWTWYQGELGSALTQWQPLTLQGAGFFHITMGAVLGIYAWKRTDEKLSAVDIKNQGG
jgi:hypothetical protein